MERRDKEQDTKGNRRAISRGSLTLCNEWLESVQSVNHPAYQFVNAEICMTDGEWDCQCKRTRHKQDRQRVLGRSESKADLLQPFYNPYSPPSTTINLVAQDIHRPHHSTTSNPYSTTSITLTNIYSFLLLSILASLTAAALP